jgi:type I restriction enzyme R subunit
MEQTIIESIISEARNEVADFQKWGFDTIPHRARMKQGFEVGDKRVDVESAFKDLAHPFRTAVVCAMWLTGFDVESLSTLYIDKPMKAHTLMQARDSAVCSPCIWLPAVVALLGLDLLPEPAEISD